LPALGFSQSSIDYKLIEDIGSMRFELSALRQQLERQQNQCKAESSMLVQLIF
jgi:hypothetical protein